MGKRSEHEILDLIKKDPRVKEVFSEVGNFARGEPDWWVYLQTGYCADIEIHNIHEQTLEKVLVKLQEVWPCDCRWCKTGEIV